jgi:formylglycine-generating enzyme required for sulfatase activity
LRGVDGVASDGINRGSSLIVRASGPELGGAKMLLKSQSTERSTAVFQKLRSLMRSAATIGLLVAAASPEVVGFEPQKAIGDRSIVLNSIGMKLVAIPSGEFEMGAPESEEGSRIDERPVHRVRISRPFHLGVYEVTQEEYKKVTGHNPSYFSLEGEGRRKVDGMDTRTLPVENISWDEAVDFCKKLSELPEEQKAGRVYRLPTEAEWQYACRAGTNTPFHYGSALGAGDANINGNFPYGGAPRGAFLGRTTKVGSYKPNAFGLYDMHGNVAELTADWYARFYFKDSPAVDPLGPETGADRVVSGGSWGTDAARCRSAFRRSNATSGKASYFGIRVACNVTTGAGSE